MVTRKLKEPVRQCSAADVLAVLFCLGDGVNFWRLRDHKFFKGTDATNQIQKLIRADYINEVHESFWTYLQLSPKGFKRLMSEFNTEQLPVLKAAILEDNWNLLGSLFACQFLSQLFEFRQKQSVEKNEQLDENEQYQSFVASHLFSVSALFVDLDDWRGILDLQPLSFFETFLEKLREDYLTHWSVLCDLSSVEFALSHLPDGEDKATLHDWFVFYFGFMQQGLPNEQLKKLSRTGMYYPIVQAIQSMNAKEPSVEAVSLMKEALKRIGKKRQFDELIPDWLWGLALYRDRANRDSQKRLQTMASSSKLMNDAKRFSLWLIAMIGTDQDPTGDLEDVFYGPKYYDGEMGIEERISRAIFIATAFNFGFVKKLAANDPLLLALCKVFPIFNVDAARLTRSASYLEEQENQFGIKALFPDYIVKPHWEQVLDRLIAKESVKTVKPRENASVKARQRLAYFLDNTDESIAIKVQKSKDGVNWSKGTDLSYGAFAKGVEGMTEQDRTVAQCLKHPFGYVSRWILPWGNALEALIGSPNVFDANNPSNRLEVVKENVRIEVKSDSTGYRFESNVPDDFIPYQMTYVISWGADNRISVMAPSPEECSLLAEMRAMPAFPQEAKGKLTQYLELLSRTTPVMSELLENSETLQKRAGDSRITLRIQPTDESSYSVKALVHPIEGAALTCEPGKGLAFLATNVAGETIRVERDLKLEAKNFVELEVALQPIDDSRESEYTWQLDMIDCLTLLDIVREHATIACVEWPEGVKFTVSKAKINADALKLSVRDMGSWFTLEGHVQVDQKSVLTVAELLEKIRSAQGQFIRLGEKEYIALSESLRKQLQTLEGLTRKGKKAKDALTISAFNAGFIDDLSHEGVKIDADEAFKQLTQRIQAAKTLNPVIPSGLRAELRPYQVEGFEWLSRLSSWGAGALLADDMGLGKTLQAIALMLSRASEGPALVLMPAAVLFNWADEIRRFAPGLNAIVLGHQKRESVIEGAKVGDVLLVTYGVLASDAALFTKKSWSTVILDEAHTIKNRDTKTSKAVMQLKSDARVLLTGTPLQNHLSEIWNLFEFANPGLLGSFQDFSERFVIAVEKNRDRDRQRLLKRILSPFILRRTKAEVLDELPEKTEVTLRVELSDEERALYENLRQSASVNLESGKINPIEALAELTKLRQAACNARLVNPTLKLESSKTKAFLELVDELHEGGHRALVFSQFTSHLALIREALDAKGIEYLYLDGATPASERHKLVEQFQHGSQPLFLISLKAGGTGLNLTAADYIIHLDPWWNPAIEDQASDRAYRIGQENPVTIYRLIAQNTIEEKILRLHETKKSLADALLEGSDLSSRLSRDEILRLLAEA